MKRPAKKFFNAMLICIAIVCCFAACENQSLSELKSSTEPSEHISSEAKEANLKDSKIEKIENSKEKQVAKEPENMQNNGENKTKEKETEQSNTETKVVERDITEQSEKQSKLEVEESSNEVSENKVVTNSEQRIVNEEKSSITNEDETTVLEEVIVENEEDESSTKVDKTEENIDRDQLEDIILEKEAARRPSHDRLPEGTAYAYMKEDFEVDHMTIKNGAIVWIDIIKSKGQEIYYCYNYMNQFGTKIPKDIVVPVSWEQVDWTNVDRWGFDPVNARSPLIPREHKFDESRTEGDCQVVEDGFYVITRNEQRIEIPKGTFITICYLESDPMAIWYSDYAKVSDISKLKFLSEGEYIDRWEEPNAGHLINRKMVL